MHAGGPSRAGSAPISMDGRAVFRLAVDALPKCLHTVLDETGLTLDNLDWVVDVYKRQSTSRCCTCTPPGSTGCSCLSSCKSRRILPPATALWLSLIHI